MKIVQSNSISLNGLIARENGEEDWLPAEGWTEFVQDVENSGNFIIGRETYEVVTRLYADYNFDSVPAKHKIIVTSQKDYPQPEGYIVVHSPQEAVDFLNNQGAETGLLVGGGKLNGAFYAQHLIDETWITINPFILGKGRPFVDSHDFENQLKLAEVIRLSKDRVQLKYHVIHSN